MSSSEQLGTAVRHANSVACLEAVRDADVPLTVSEISESTGLSRPTVDAVLSELAERRVVSESGSAATQGAGRPARRFRFEDGNGTVVGVDVGPHNIRILVSDLSGRILTRHTTRITHRLDATERIRDLRRSVSAAIKDAHRQTGSLRAVSLGVPGILDDRQRIVQSLAITEWIDHDLVGRLEDAWGCPVVLENDIKLAALAEHHAGADRQVDNLTFFQIGHRVSLALIMYGRILQGSHRLAGELGSLRGMKWTSTSVRGQLRWRTARTAKAVFARAADGDADATQEVDDFCAEIAPRIASILLTVDPEVVVVGGGLSRAGEAFLSPLRRAVEHVLMTPHQPSIVASSLTSDGVVIGALGSAFDQCSTEITGLTSVPPPWHLWRPDHQTPTKQGEVVS